MHRLFHHFILFTALGIALLWGGNTMIYQPQEKDFKHPEWRKQINLLKANGFDKIILQWSAYGKHRFYAHHPQWLHHFLTLAAEYDIEVFIGLYADPRYFDKIQDKKTDISLYLNTLYFKNMQTAYAVWRSVKNEKAFKGWYMYDEMNDVTWKEKERHKALRAYLLRVHEGLMRLAPKKEIIISAYFTGVTKASIYAAMLAKTVPQSWLLLLQSGVGAGLVNSATCLQYYQTFNKVYLRTWEPIIEIFRFDKKEPTSSFQSLMEQKKCIQKPYAFFSWRYFFDPGFYHAYRTQGY